MDSIFGDKGVKGNILMRSSDVDVFIIAAHYFPHMRNTKELWIHAGSVSHTTNNHRYIAVHEIYQAFQPNFCSILPVVHSLTGFDITSAFYYISKKFVFNIALDLCELQDLVLILTEKATTAAYKLIAFIYYPKEKYKQYAWQH